jgi:glutathione S-transferase
MFALSREVVMTLILYHAPQTRSSTTRVLLEELGVPYELKVMNLKAGDQRQPDFLALNPLGKVPCIVHDNVVVTEQVAIMIYLCDAFPQARLAPTIEDKLRGPYLRWMAHYAAAYEPALIDRSEKREVSNKGACPYGSFDRLYNEITTHLEDNAYILGHEFSAADILWARGLRWGAAWKMVPLNDAISGYIDRITSRPSFSKVAESDATLKLEQETALAS